MAPTTDRTTCVPFGGASPVTTSHAAQGSVFVNSRNTGNSENWPPSHTGDVWQKHAWILQEKELSLREAGVVPSAFVKEGAALCSAKGIAAATGMERSYETVAS